MSFIQHIFPLTYARYSLLLSLYFIVYNLATSLQLRYTIAVPSIKIISFRHYSGIPWNASLKTLLYVYYKQVKRKKENSWSRQLPYSETIIVYKGTLQEIVDNWFGNTDVHHNIPPPPHARWFSSHTSCCPLPPLNTRSTPIQPFVIRVAHIFTGLGAWERGKTLLPHHPLLPRGSRAIQDQ